MRTLKPFRDDRASRSIGGLTIENGRDKLSLYGSLDITRDGAGLERARALKALADAVVAALEADEGPADAAPPTRPTRRVRNPFA